jgi:hypothetical protein
MIRRHGRIEKVQDIRKPLPFLFVAESERRHHNHYNTEAWPEDPVALRNRDVKTLRASSGISKFRERSQACRVSLLVRQHLLSHAGLDNEI